MMIVVMLVRDDVDDDDSDCDDGDDDDDDDSDCDDGDDDDGVALSPFCSSGVARVEDEDRQPSASRCRQQEDEDSVPGLIISLIERLMIEG